MKEGIHPDYREVLFVDMSIDFKFVTRSTIQTRETAEFNGKTYPLAKIEVSSESHPFYTGKMKYVDSAGRVEKFQKKYNWDKRNQKQDSEDAVAEIYRAAELARFAPDAH